MWTGPELLRKVDAGIMMSHECPLPSGHYRVELRNREQNGGLLYGADPKWQELCAKCQVRGH